MRQKQIKGLNLEELTSLCNKEGFSSFRAKQIYHWMYRHRVMDIALMNNIPDNVKKFIEDNYTLKTLEIERIQDSNVENTKKILFKTADGMFIESVSMIDKTLHTVCISSQVGCNVDCKFCATGLMGFSRNLSCGEIIDQIIEITKLREAPITNVVYMGMGEPLLNVEPVMASISLMQHQNAYGLSKRRITLSTSGIVPEINKLADKTDVSLAISLHAANNILRDQIVQINKK